VGRSDKNLTKKSPPSKTIKNKQVGWIFSNPALLEYCSALVHRNTKKLEKA